ncbi:uncharacterized protein TNCV_1521611 [Trichonephila clavipes]|nr:uncharacterized protein TNCV_1521611 [Trichonephila clavipes]
MIMHDLTELGLLRYLEDHGFGTNGMANSISRPESDRTFLGLSWQRVAALNPPPRSLHELKQGLLCVWSSLPYCGVGITFQDGDRFNSCQVIYSQFGLAIHQNDHQARRRFVEWAQNEITVVPDFHKRILFSDEAHFWLNGYVNKQNCHIWSEANPQVYVETPLHPEKLTVWCALWAGGILLQKR